MYPIPHSEQLIENRTCRKCSTAFPITDKDMDFYSKVSPTFGGKKYQIPSPTLCPDCRQQRRLSFHNERKLYKSVCKGTGKNIISVYPPHSPYLVFSTEYYWSDSWDPIDYGLDYNSSRSFFDQFTDLFRKIPKQALVVKECENSDYLNFAYKVKNCYLIFASSENEDSYFGNRVNESKNCVDCLLVKKSEHCYECIGASQCYNCKYSERIQNCKNSSFLKDCMNCSDCFMCINLQNKKYCIKNVEYSESEYREKRDEYEKISQGILISEYSAFITNEPRKQGHIIQVENTLGDNIQNAKDGKYVFDGDMIENVSYSYFIDYIKDSMDVNYGNINNVLQYESLGTWANAHNILFSINTWPDVYNLIYCDSCSWSSYCFGCTWLRNKSYCILNRQYTKEEYEVLVPKIIEKMMFDWEWWEFFPVSLSPFGYNETVANEYFPLEKEQAKILHFNWSDYEAPFPKVEKIIQASRLPDSIEWIPDDILNWAIECEVSEKPFRIIKQELEFYRKHSLPIPKRHPDVRHMDRMKLRNPRKLFERKCDKCNKDMITTYSPERPERVYCEECYEKEVLS